MSGLSNEFTAIWKHVQDQFYFFDKYNNNGFSRSKFDENEILSKYSSKELESIEKIAAEKKASGKKLELSDVGYAVFKSHEAEIIAKKEAKLMMTGGRPDPNMQIQPPGVVALNSVHRAMQEVNYSQTYLKAGDDPAWDNGVHNFEWRFKQTLLQIMNANLPDNMRPDGNGKTYDTMFYTKEWASQANCFNQINIRGYLPLNDLDPAILEDVRGGIRIKPQDFLQDGRKMLTIDDKGSITTYNKDGSVRGFQTRQEVITELNTLHSLNETGFYLSLYRNDPNADSRLIY